MNLVGYFYLNGIGTTALKDSAMFWLRKAAEMGNGESWYHLGTIYQNRKDSMPDFNIAFLCYTKSSELNNALGMYAKGYMFYKGFGCKQDYDMAYQLFKSSANLNIPNAMFFLGLCYRNGYGTIKSADSANYWLKASANKGYLRAKYELDRDTPEVDEFKIDMSANAVNVQPVININKYTKIENTIALGAISGEYTGSIIRYDWRGKHIVEQSPLTLTLKYQQNGEFNGVWKEGNSIVTKMSGELSPTQLSFNNTIYKRADRYSNKILNTFIFQKGNLNWYKKGDSVYVSGFIQLFSPERGEPDKPTFVSLSKKVSSSGSNTMVNFLDDEASKTIKVYPNPFSAILNVEFFIDSKKAVQTQLIAENGQVVYNNVAGLLEPGFYKLPIKSNHIVPGIYVISIKMGNTVKSVKVIKH